MSKKSESSNELGLLFLVFLVLKLTHVIDWSWWWVTAPLWGALALFVVGVIVAIIVAYIKCKVKERKAWKEFEKGVDDLVKKSNQNSAHGYTEGSEL